MSGSRYKPYGARSYRHVRLLNGRAHLKTKRQQQCNDTRLADLCSIFFGTNYLLCLQKTSVLGTSFFVSPPEVDWQSLLCA
eukprot:1161345-Pelagomonas_calceolata.AAC.5